MSAILKAGISRGLSNINEDGLLKLNHDEQKFVTYINDIGGVHTIVVDLDHPAQTGEELLSWFLNTKAAVQSGEFDNDPQGVLAHAHAVTKSGHPFREPVEPDTYRGSGGRG